MQVSIDEDRCVGSGQCVLALPRLFDQRTDDSVSEVIAQPGPAEADAVRRAAHVCPAVAIDIRE